MVFNTYTLPVYDNPVYVELSVRDYNYSLHLNESLYYDETLNGTEYYTKSICLNNTALVLVDLWGGGINGEHSDRGAAHFNNSILPLIDYARSIGLTTIYTKSNYRLSPLITPLPGEYVIDWNPVQLMRKLNKTIGIYAGYAADQCLLYEPNGVIYAYQCGIDVIVLRDCTMASETKESLENEWHKKTAINIIESRYGCSSTLDDFKNMTIKKKSVLF